MSRYSRTHLSDGALLQSAKQHMAEERNGTVEALADLAEIDARKLYLPAAYPNMISYCMGELHLCEQAAYKRIHAARAARKFPAIFTAVAEGRLHLSAVVLLASRLTPENADELLAAATHKSKTEIGQLLAERFPRMDVPAAVRQLSNSLSPGKVNEHTPGHSDPSPEAVPRCIAPSKVTPLAPERYALQCTLCQSTYETLQYALALLGHQVAPNDLPTVIDRALKALVEQLEKSKFAKTSRPRPGRRGGTSRHIPAEVKRHVWERDGGQCTFVSENGRRCAATSRLEFDHADPVARGGQGSLDKIRLRCRAHNQYGAECVYGVAFMNHKRNEAQRTAERRKSEHIAEPRAAKPAPEPDPERDVTPWLRSLGFRADEVRRAAAHCESIPDASLEDRVRLALSCLAPPCRKIEARAAS
jgi:hypothetical protein